MERYRIIGSVDNFDGQQNLEEWIQMVGRAADFAGWTEEQTFKAALFRLRGEAGEHVEQLRSEDKIKTWKELQDVLKERFQTTGKEQWHQYLLNTGTQGSKTVQEWAQTVRKLSLLALGPERKGIEEREEEEGQGEQEQAKAEEMKKKEARKGLLDYMRKSNFVRGLRSNLRQMVWRKKCATFDEAVQAAAEEEAVEASHREEEVLSCYKGDLPDITSQGLVEKIVAALEIRDGKKEDGDRSSRKDAPKGAKKGAPGRYRTRETRREPSPVSDREYDDEDGEEDEYPERRNQRNHHRMATSPFRRGPGGRGTQRYSDQLPLPRPAPRTIDSQEWNRRDRRDEGTRTAGGIGRGHRSYNLPGVCFNCHQPCHYRRECPHPQEPQPGNGYRRLH